MCAAKQFRETVTSLEAQMKQGDEKFNAATKKLADLQKAAADCDNSFYALVNASKAEVDAFANGLAFWKENTRTEGALGRCACRKKINKDQSTLLENELNAMRKRKLPFAEFFQPNYSNSKKILRDSTREKKKE